MTNKFISTDQYLIVAGSTRSNNGNERGGVSNEDGFITILYVNTSELASDRKNNERIGSSEDDFISGICDDRDDAGSFCIVGATEGLMPGIQTGTVNPLSGSLSPLITKINTEFWFMPEPRRHFQIPPSSTLVRNDTLTGT